MTTPYQKLALFGGPKAIKSDPEDMFDWPIVTPEIEQAVLGVLRAGKMSGTDVTKQLEQEYAKWHGVKYALAHNTGTVGEIAHQAGFSDQAHFCRSFKKMFRCTPTHYREQHHRIEGAEFFSMAHAQNGQKDA